MNTENIKKRAKSSRFPAIGLGKAAEIMEEAIKHGKSFKKETFATFGSRKDNKGSAKSGAFIRRIAALKYFGLIEEKGANIEITGLAEKIVFPKDIEEKKEAIIQAFFTSPLFDKLYKDTLKNIFVKKEDLAHIAIREHGIAPNAKDDFISSFISSAEFAGLLKFSEDKMSVIFSEPENITKVNRLTDTEIKEETKGDAGSWNVMINKKDDSKRYELQFKSKEMVSGSLLDKLNSFIGELEKEFQKEEKEEAE